MLNTTLWLWILNSKALLVAAESQQDDSFVPFCEDGGIRTCDKDRLTRISVDLLIAFVLAYFGVICCILVYKLKMFNSLPYSRAQAAIVFYRFQARHPLIACSSSQSTSSTCTVLFAYLVSHKCISPLRCKHQMTCYIHAQHSQHFPSYCLLTPLTRPKDRKC